MVTSSVLVSFVGAGFVVVATIFLDLVMSLLTSCLATVVGWQTGVILVPILTTNTIFLIKILGDGKAYMDL